MENNIQNENTQSLNEEDIIKIAEIEQDGWAHGIWEYRKCDDCWHIHSKQDVYWDVPRGVYTNTVKKIYTLLWKPEVLCQLCQWNTSEIYWENYIESIQKRYKNQTSFLTTYRNSSHTIQGFLDWYMADFETIYKNEFEAYYKEIWKENIKKRIEIILKQNIPNPLLATSALCIHEKHKSLYIVYNLMKSFYSHIENNYWDTMWIYESNIGTNIHKIHMLTWWRPIWIENINNKNTNKKYTSDIIIHENIWEASRVKLGHNLKDFLMTNKGRTRKIIEMSKK